MDQPAGTTGPSTDALDGVSEWVLILKPEGIVEWSNRAFNEFMGGQAPGGTQWNIRHLFFADSDRVMDDIRDVIGTGQLRSGIIRPVQGIDGERKVIRYTVLRHKDPAQDTCVIYLYGLDITDTIEMEELKKTDYYQIEKNIEQFDILGDHLRNPLTAIVGLCDLLEEKEIAEKIQARAREIDDRITQIDRGWIDSEKVRNIIRK